MDCPLRSMIGGPAAPRPISRSLRRLSILAKKGLGKGLGALIGSSLADEDSVSVAEVPLNQTQANPYQPRKFFADSALAELADSIREHGIIQPVIVKRTGDQSYELVA